jgi:hypothetical protein
VVARLLKLLTSTSPWIRSPVLIILTAAVVVAIMLSKRDK